MIDRTSVVLTLWDLVPDDVEVQSLCAWADYEEWSADRLADALRRTKWYRRARRFYERG